MEHNHDLLKFKFALTVIMLIVGMGIGFLGTGGVDVQSKIVIFFFGGLIIVVGIIILRRTFKERDSCEICKERYYYGKKK